MEVVLYQVANASGCIKKRLSLGLVEAGEEATALGEGDGVREDSSDGGEGDARGGNEMVLDAELVLGVDAKRAV